MYTVDSPEIKEALEAWHEAGRAHWNATYENLDYDRTNKKSAWDRKNYIALDYGAVNEDGVYDAGRSGAFLVDKQTGDVYVIKGYGKKGRLIGSLRQFIDFWKSAPDANPYRLIYVKGINR